MKLKPVPLLRFLARWIYSWLFLFTVTRFLPILYIAGDCLQVYTACEFVSSEPFPAENGAWLAESCGTGFSFRSVTAILWLTPRQPGLTFCVPLGSSQSRSG